MKKQTGRKKRPKKDGSDQLLDIAIDDFIIPLANMHLNKKNKCNIVELCRQAAKWMETPL